MRGAVLRSALVWYLVATWSMAPVGEASAQEPEGEPRGPRFLLASTSSPTGTEPVDISRTPSLRQRIALDLDNVTIKEALAAIARQSGLRLAYTADVLPAHSRVRLRAEEITVAGALTDVLVDVNVDVVFTSDGRAVLRKRDAHGAMQQGMIAGRVTDAANGQPLALVDVRVVGTQIATTTDDSGRYTLRDVPTGEQQISARRIGYEAQTTRVAVVDVEGTTVDFALKVIATRLDELVTTVTGEQRRLEVGNTIATIDADSLLQTAPVMSFGDLVQGRAPGVLSLQEGGFAGQSGRIRIRGLNSINAANDPIVVVDGVRVEAGSGTGSATATNVPGGGFSGAGGLTGRLADFDPDEIASVEIVKGPSAATLYGTDAANGVLVITTKRGQLGRTRWTAFTEQGLLEQRLDLTDAFPDAYYAFGRSTADDTPQLCTLLQRAEGSCVVDSLGAFNTYSDPATRPLKDSWREQYGLQVSGGTAGGTTYFLSGNYEQETGPAHMPVIDQALIRATQARAVPDWQVRPNALERLNLRANVTAPLGRRASATLSTGFISNQARQPANRLPSVQVGYRNANDGWEDFGGIFNVRPAYTFAFRGEDVVRRFLGSLATTYTVRDWLTLRGTLGTDLSTNAYGTLERRGEGGFIGAFASRNTGRRDANDLSVARYSLDLGATATRNLSAAVTSKTSLGVQYNRRAQRGTFVQATDLPLGGETIAGAGTVFPPSEATLTTAVAGGYLEEVLGFRDRLFLTGALRLDGGSAFGQDFSVTAYPKAHLSWLVTDGQAGPRLPGVSSLRLRAAYGASGVQPGPTDALARVTVAQGFTVDGTATGPTAVLVAGNPDLKPERSSELEAGLDLELWQSRVRLEFTAYQRTTEDALISRPNAASVGGSRVENLGSVRNRGLELGLSADLLRGRTMAAGFTATGALNDNELRRLGEGVLLSSPADEFTRQEEGYPLFGLWGYRVESFADANGNGILEPAEVVLSGPNSQFIGPTIPRREATVAPYVKLFGERLHLSTLLQYRGGFYRYNAPAWNPCLFGASCQAVNDPSTPLAEQARAVAVTTFGRSGPMAEDGSYLLLRELSLGLTVPPSVARVLGAQAGQVVLAGRNLALLWKASPLPIESAGLSQDIESSNASSITPGPSTYWLLRVHLTY